MSDERQLLIPDAVSQRLRFVASCYEMEPQKLLTLILITSLDELTGHGDEMIVCVPTEQSDATP